MALTILLGLVVSGGAVIAWRLIARLSAAERHYRLLFENNPQPMWVYDQQTLAFLAVNNAATQRYGYSADEFRRMTLRDIRPPEDVPRLLEATRRPATELHSEGLWRHRKRDGSVITVEIIEHPIRFSGQDACLVMPRDISQEIKTEGALREGEERLQLALDATHEGLWDWNVTSGAGYLSPRYYAILGYETGEFTVNIGNWTALLHPDDAENAARQVADEIQRTGGAFSVECRMRKKSGEYVWVLSRGTVITRTPEGRPERLVGTILDITDRKSLEAQFQQAQRLESIGRMAGGVAHDFNNLLTAINGFADMLLADEGIDEERRTSVQEIRSAGERATALTQQLLAFSRKQVLQPAVVNVNGIVTEIDRLLRRLVGENIALVNHLDPDIDNILADAAQLQQVIVNLAVNSRDAMPGGGTLTIETQNVEFDEGYLGKHPDVRPGAHVMLAVSDNGCGMPPEVKEHIFEPFFTTKPKGVGTGLGLATVYGMVKQSGGWIWVYSELGEGTSVRIYFPRTGQTAAPQASSPRAALRGAETILVVEDQREVRDLAVAALRRYGYTVHASSGAAEALRFLETSRDPIHLLLSDVIMPGINGRDLADALLERLSGLRVLLMSGYPESATTLHGVSSRKLPYLAKPFTPEQLARKVREVLGGSAT